MYATSVVDTIIPLSSFDEQVRQTLQPHSRTRNGSMKLRIAQCICISILAVFQSSITFAQNAEAARRQVPEDEILMLLISGKYSELSRKLQRLQSAYIADSSTENEVHKAFYEFGRADESIYQSIDKWIAAQPKDAMAYLARGIYRTHMGWQSRGGDFSAKTTDRQFSGMAAWFKAAKDDLDRSVRLDPTIVEAYCYLIEIDVNEGRRLTPELYRQALKVKPDSFIAREYYLWSQLPRWGGSHEEMAATILAARPYYEEVPQLAALEGRIDADIGEMAAYRNEYQVAIKHFERAIAKGDFWFTNQKYGEALAAVNDHKAAIDQYSRVIQNKPGYKRAWEMRAQSYSMLGKLSDALADITYAISIEPRDDSTIASRGRILGRSGNFEAALIDFKKAEQINPSDPAHKKMIRFVQEDLNKFETSRNGLKK